MYYPDKPAFNHHHSTRPSGNPHENGEAGHVITVSTESKAVAKGLLEIYSRIFKDAKMEAIKS